MPMIELPDMWANPFQRMGIISVNVLMGQGLRPSDADLFFGPLNGREVWCWELAPNTTLARLLTHLKLFPSAKEAARRGYAGEIPEGFTDLTITAPMRFTSIKKHRVTILKITRETPDESTDLQAD